MIRSFLITVCAVVGSGCSALLYLPPEKADRPEGARFVTDDLPRFYEAVDAAGAPPGGAPLDPGVFAERYLNAGTRGLRAFDALTIGGAERLAVVVTRRRAYYDAIRADVLRLREGSAALDSVRAALGRLERVYPAASFPDVTFVVGRMNTGGTVSSRGLLIGVELFMRGPETPTDGFTAWQLSNTRSPDLLPHVVVHEVVHAQQRLLTLTRGSLLSRALVEGGADFVASLATGDVIAPEAHEYGLRNEAEVWQEFAARMDGGDLSGWFYGSPSDPSRPADLGYFVGYRIAEAYYNLSTDKESAIRDIIRLRDPRALLEESGYPDSFD